MEAQERRTISKSPSPPALALGEPWFEGRFGRWLETSESSHIHPRDPIPHQQDPSLIEVDSSTLSDGISIHKMEEAGPSRSIVDVSSYTGSEADVRVSSSVGTLSYSGSSY